MNKLIRIIRKGDVAIAFACCNGDNARAKFALVSKPGTESRKVAYATWYAKQMQKKEVDRQSAFVK